MRLAKAYSKYLDHQPFWGTVSTGTILCFCGDIITQTFIEGRSILGKSENLSKPYDYARTVRAGVIGASAISLNLFVWYKKVLPFIMTRFQNLSLMRKYPVFISTVLGMIYILYKVNFYRPRIVCPLD